MQARSKVAGLLHMQKARQAHIAKLREQLATATDVAGKDAEAIQAAMRAEHELAKRKRRVVLGMAMELQQQLSRLQSVQRDIK